MIIWAFKIQDDVAFFRQERPWSLRGALLTMSQGCADTRWGETASAPATPGSTGGQQKVSVFSCLPTYELHILPQVLGQQRIGLVVRNPN